MGGSKGVGLGGPALREMAAGAQQTNRKAHQGSMGVEIHTLKVLSNSVWTPVYLHA